MDIYLKYYNSLIFIKFVIKYFIQKANVILVSIIFDISNIIQILILEDVSILF